MSSAFAFPVDYIADPEKFGAVGLGELYIGVVDGDPANNPADRIQVYLSRQNDTDLPLPQPIDLSPGGVPYYNGSPATLKVDSEYSIAVLDFLGSQIYYSPKCGEWIERFKELEFSPRVVQTMADLRAIDDAKIGQKFLLNEHGQGTGLGGGEFTAVEGDYIDDNGYVVVTANSVSLVRTVGDHVEPQMWGALCNGSSDDSSAFSATIRYIADGGINRVLISSQFMARVNNITIPASVTFYGGGQIKRLDDCDIPAVGNLGLSPGVFVFDVTNPDCTVRFDSLTLDANQAKQTNLEPTGIFVRVGNMTTTDQNLRTVIHFHNVTYKNNCKLAIYTFLGDLSAHRAHVIVTGKTSFTNGRFNTTDYDSDFLRLTDRTDLWVSDATFGINESPVIGQYTFPAVRLTVAASGFGVDDGPRCWIDKCDFTNLGRPTASVDAIGVIDFYRQAKDVHITDCNFYDCKKSPVRGKTSAQRVSVRGCHMINCLDDYAINITPASTSTPPNFGQYIVDGNIIENCSGMVSIVAETSFSDPSFDVQITNNIGKGVSGSNFAIYARRIDGILLDNNVVNGSANGGVQLRECSKQKIGRTKIYNIVGSTSDHGIWVRSSYGDIEISECEVLTASGQGISATIDGAYSGKFSVTSCTVNDTVDYGVIANTGNFTTIRFCDNDIFNISGLDRAFFAPSTRSALIVAENATDAATPLVNSGGAVKSELGNSWQMS